MEQALWRYSISSISISIKNKENKQIIIAFIIQSERMHTTIKISREEKKQ